MTRSKPPRTDQSRRGPSSRREPRQRPKPAPGTITAIAGQAHDPDRVSIFIDGDFALGVARDIADELGLHTGLSLDQAALADLLAREDLHRATAAALTFLAYRPRSEGEIRTRLRKADVPDDTISLVIDRLRSWHYVDDADFARRWIENRATHRPRGARLLAEELRAKGIPPQLMAEALDEAEIDEFADALELARQRSRQLAGLEPAVRERRLSGFLARRGYGFDVIRTTLNTLREEAGAEELDSGDA
jgi:regulatory protein